jgi:D-serine deaminase-like pyridoxal phosphate-dependent protein
MNRRQFVLGAAAATVGGLWLAKPSDRGAPYDDYFRALNAELKREGPMRPCLVIDLDRMDQNLERVVTTLKRGGKHYRIVEKSLPSQKLIEHIMRKADTKRLMSFHQPFINADVVAFPDVDILLGKPLPMRSAELFYRNLKGPFDPSRQLQWLLDTPERLQQYLELANGLGTKLRANIEIDVGLHRGGVHDDATLVRMLELIAANPQRLEFAGFMGYDAHVGVGVPDILGTPQELLDKAMVLYQARVDFARSRYPQLWNDTLTLNSGGSPSYKLHAHERVSNDISVGTALLKPARYDLETLTDHVPAVFIATPVIKATGPIELPVLDEKSGCFRGGTRTSARPTSSTAAGGSRSTNRRRACSSTRSSATARTRKSSTARPPPGCTWTTRCSCGLRSSKACCSISATWWRCAAAGSSTTGRH